MLVSHGFSPRTSVRSRKAAVDSTFIYPLYRGRVGFNHRQVVIQQSLTYLLIQASTLVFQQLSQNQAQRPRAIYKQLAATTNNTGNFTSSLRYLIMGLAQVLVYPLAVYIRVSSQSQYAFVRLRSLLQPLVLHLFYCFRWHGYRLLFLGVATPVLYTYQRNPIKVLQLYPIIQKPQVLSIVKARPKPPLSK